MNQNNEQLPLLSQNGRGGITRENIGGSTFTVGGSNGIEKSGTNTASFIPNGDSDNKNNNKDEEQQQKHSRGAYKDVVPTWKEMMDYLIPYLKPLDCKHMTLATVALVSVMGGKIINVLPPLAIKYAVDLLTKYYNHRDDSNNLLVDVDNDNEAEISTIQSTSSVQLLAPAEGGVERHLIYAILIYFGLKLLTLLNGAGQDLAQRTVALDAERRFGNKIFEHLHTLSLGYHFEKHIGEVTRVMSRGVDAVSTVISSFLFYLLPTFFEAVVVSAVFWKLGTPAIALTTVIAVVLYLWFTVAITQTRITYRRRLIEASDAVGQKETETLVNYETVSMFGRTQYEIDAYSNLRQIYKDRRVTMLGMFAIMEFGQKFVRLGGVAVGLFMAGMAAINDPTHFTAGSFVVIQMYIDQLFQPLTMLGWQYRMITQAFTDLEKAVTLLMRVPDVKDLPNAIEWNPTTSTVASTESNSISTNHHDDNISNTYNKGCTILFQNVTFRYKVDATRESAIGGCAKGGDSILLKSNSRGRHGGRRGRSMAAIVSSVDEQPSGNNKKQSSPLKTTTSKNIGRSFLGFFQGNGANSKSEKIENSEGSIVKDVDAETEKGSSSSSSCSTVEEDNDCNKEKMAVVQQQQHQLGGVSNINFTVKAGTTTALVGSSGSGKTTLVRLVLRMYDTDVGSVLVDGRDVRSYKQQSLRQHIGVVAQDTILFNASLRENIVYGKRDATEEEIWSAVRASALEEFVNGLPQKLETMVGERGMKLSGGERQRVGMARCIIKNPSIILLDEATSALDSATERHIQTNIQLLCNNRTTIMIAHRLSTAKKANEIIVLNKGEIVERGTHQELLQITDGHYSKMWHIQTTNEEE